MWLLRDRLDALAPDLPGFSCSPLPRDANYSAEAHARTVAKLIEDTVGQPVHLMGNSLGGAVATLVAARRPDLVRTLTLVSPALPVSTRPGRPTCTCRPLRSPSSVSGWPAGWAASPSSPGCARRLALCFADPSRVAPERFEEAVAEASRRARLDYESEAMLATLRALIAAYLRRGPSTLWKAAAHVQAPTLLVYGLRDKLVDPKTRRRPRANLSPVAAARAPGQRARRADGAPRGRGRGGAQVHRPGGQSATLTCGPFRSSNSRADHPAQSLPQAQRSQPPNSIAQAAGGFPRLVAQVRPVVRGLAEIAPPGQVQHLRHPSGAASSPLNGTPRPSARSRRSPASRPCGPASAGRCARRPRGHRGAAGGCPGWRAGGPPSAPGR